MIIVGAQVPLMANSSARHNNSQSLDKNRMVLGRDANIHMAILSNWATIPLSISCVAVNQDYE